MSNVQAASQEHYVICSDSEEEDLSEWHAHVVERSFSYGIEENAENLNLPIPISLFNALNLDSSSLCSPSSNCSQQLSAKETVCRELQFLGAPVASVYHAAADSDPQLPAMLS